MADVVIVGAGPIGLAYAWAIKKLNPNLNIVIHEKYEEYQRKHTLNIQPHQLEALMKATDTEEHPELKALLKRLKKNRHIRTNEIEEIFKRLALEVEVGCEPTRIIIGEIKKESFQEQILDAYPEAKLILGADGTHSVVSEAIFGSENQHKREFDYVLQLRYEIEGESKADSIEMIKFYQEMARNGLIASEYVGSLTDGKTPVTMQMIISKKVFNSLKSIATSKNPIYLNTNDAQRLPQDVRHFLSRYLEHKFEKCHENKNLIDMWSVRASVNELPATHAQEISARIVRDDASRTIVQLVGDSSLGLSYFKGLNAGLEAATRFLTLMKDSIKHGFAQEHSENGLRQYRDWFSIFAHKKINEVSQYSRFLVRAPQIFMQAFQKLKGFSYQQDMDSSESLLKDYYQLELATPGQHGEKWHKFPHRSYDPVVLGNWNYIPVTYSIKKIFKLFADYFKPYKTTNTYFHLKQDFRQPGMGLVNIFSGVVKLVVGLLTLKPKRFVDGLFSLIRGSIELGTFPLAWTIKPITRNLTTLIYRAFWGPKRIEDNNGMRKLAKQGLEAIDTFEENLKVCEPTAQSTYNILALCHDMHRKFLKEINRGQITEALDEGVFYDEATKEGVVEPYAARQYFSLFYCKPKTDFENPNSECRFSTI